MPMPADRGSPAPRPSIPDPQTMTSEEDWYGRDLAQVSYARHTFLDTDWTEVTNQGSVFDECVFSGVRFNASRHSESAFLNCVFHRCVLFDTRFEGCKLVGSHFQGSTFTLLQVTGGDWSFARLSGADLRKSSFDGVRMREVDLAEARLEESALTGCDLSAAGLRDAPTCGAATCPGWTRGRWVWWAPGSGWGRRWRSPPAWGCGWSSEGRARARRHGDGLVGPS